MNNSFPSKFDLTKIVSNRENWVATQSNQVNFNVIIWKTSRVETISSRLTFETPLGCLPQFDF